MRRLGKLLACTPDETLAFIAVGALDLHPGATVVRVVDHEQELGGPASCDGVVLEGVLTKSADPLGLLRRTVAALRPGGALGIVELTSDPDFTTDQPKASEFVRRTRTIRPAYAYVPILEEAGLEIRRAELRPAETAEVAKRFERIARTSLLPASRRLAWELAEAAQTNLLELALWTCVKTDA